MLTETPGPLWRRLADAVIDDVRSGKRAPGSKLPSVAEQDVAGISQTTTMRAYRELVALGVAVSVHGKGTYIADPLPDLSSRPTPEDQAAQLRAVQDSLAAIEKRLAVLEKSHSDPQQHANSPEAS